MGYRHGTATLDGDLAENAHALVGWTGIPIDKTDVRFAGLCAEHLYSQHVLLADIRGDIDGKLTEGTCHLLRGCYLMAVKPHVGTITDAVEGEEG